MLIRQRSTFADEFLLQVVCPYLRSTQARRLLALARLWNHVVEPDLPDEALRPLGLVRDAWKRVTSALWLGSARVSIS